MKKYIAYIPLVALVIAFGQMAFLGLTGSEELFKIVSVFGQSEAVSSLLVHGVFVLDGGVALLLIFGNKIRTPFPWGYLFLWVGVWPWFPRVLEYLGGRKPEYEDAIALSIFAIIAYMLWKRKNIAFFSESTAEPKVTMGV